MGYDYNEFPLALLMAENKKADLLVKGKILGLKVNMSMKKETIIDKIADSILHNPMNFLNKIPVEDVLILQEIIHCEKHQYVISPRLLTNNSLIEFGVVDLTMPWIDLDEQECMFIYKDLYEALAPIIDDYVVSAECQDRKDREQIILGILNLYGVVEISELEELYHLYRPGCDKLCETICNSYLFTCNTRMDESIQRPVFISPFLFDYPYTDTCIKEHQKEKRALFTEKEVRAAGTCTFPMPLIKEAEPLKKLLQSAGITEEETEELISNIWVLSNNDQNPGDIIFKALNGHAEKISRASLFKQLEIYSDFINHLPTWSLKGQTPNYITGEDVAIPKKKGSSPKKKKDDDLCPCGSGKKYNKCCGNN